VLGLAGPLYGGATAVLGAIFLALAVRIWRSTGDRAAKHMFAYSILYLFLLFALLLAEHGLGWRA
jgi:protoheme IX farnesyltransferase